MSVPHWEVPFEAAWAIAMRTKRARDWLFDASPLNLSDCLAACKQLPVMTGFSFTPARMRPSDYPIPEIGQLILVAYQDPSLILCTCFNVKDKHALMPAIRFFTQDPCFDDDRTMSHRIAYFAHPSDPTLLLRMDCLWLRSGVLTVGYTLHPVASVFATPASPTPAVVQIHMRVFSPEYASRLRAAALFPDPAFLDGSSLLLQPGPGYLSMDIHDTRHQSACVFCISRQLPNCACPVLFRRRRQTSVRRPPPSHRTRDTLPRVAWAQYEQCIRENTTTGVMTVNWRSVRPRSAAPAVERVLASRLFSYGMFHNTGVHAKRLIQRLFNDQGMALGSAQRCISAISTPDVSINDSSNVVRPPPENGECVLDITEASSLETEAGNSMPTQSVPTSELVQSDPATPARNTRRKPRHIQRPMPPLPVIRRKPRSPNPLVGHPVVGYAVVSTQSQGATAPSATESAPAKGVHRENVAAAAEDPASASSSGSGGSKSSAEARGTTGGASSSAAAPTSSLRDGASSTSSPSNATPVASSAGGAAGFSGAARGRGRRAGSGDISEREAPNLWRCRECGKLIRGKRGNLNRHHANRHDMLRPFQCTIASCRKRFQTRLNLVRHTRTVHDGRPQQCDKCPRAFKTQEELDAHLRIAHSAPGQTMACEICGRCFGRRSTLNRHITKVHGKKAQNVPTAKVPDAAAG